MKLETVYPRDLFLSFCVRLTWLILLLATLTRPAFSFQGRDELTSYYDPDLYLVVDDYWISKSENVFRVFNQAEPLPEPIIWPEDPRVESDCAWGSVIREKDGKFRLWYCTMMMGEAGGGPHEMAAAGVWGRGADFTFNPRSKADTPDYESMLGKYAESDDGLKWRKPDLGLIEFRNSKSNNIILNGAIASSQTNNALTNFDGYSVLRDDAERDPEKRYKMIAHWESVHFWDNHPVSGSLGRPQDYIDRCAQARGEYITESPDGLVWNRPLQKIDMPTSGGDRLLVVPDPLQNRWMAYVRFGGWAYPSFSFSQNLIDWSPAQGAKEISPADADAPAVECMIPFAYGNQYIGFPCGMDKAKGEFTVKLASRHLDTEWTWANKKSNLIPRGEPGSYYSTGAVPLHNAPFIIGDEMLIYFNAFARDKSAPSKFGSRSIGVAKLRRDGFAGMQLHDGNADGTIQFKPLKIRKERLFINFDPTKAGGRCRVAILDRTGKEISGFGFADSVPIESNCVRGQVQWHDHADLNQLLGDEVQVAIRIEGSGTFYAFAFQ